MAGNIVDNISLLTNLSLAALIIIVFYLLARQALPILDRIATALTKHMARMDAAQTGINDTLEEIRNMLDADMRMQGHKSFTHRRDRRPPLDEDE